MNSSELANEAKKILNECLKENYFDLNPDFWYKISPDIYGTSYAARAGIESSLNVLSRSQLEDGSWGEGYPLPHRILSTLESMVSLEMKQRKYERQAAIDFLEENYKTLSKDEKALPRGIYIALEQAKKVGLDLPYEKIEARIGLNNRMVLQFLTRSPIDTSQENGLSFMIYDIALLNYLLMGFGEKLSKELIERQLPNGSWQCFTNTTYFALEGIKNLYGSSNIRYEKGVKWLNETANPNGCPQFNPAEILNIGMTLYYFDRAGLRLPCDRELVEIIKSSQLNNGGWGFTKEIPLADTDDSSLALKVLTRRKITGSFVEDGKKFILSCKVPDAGISAWQLPREFPSVDATIHSLEILTHEENLKEECIRWVKSRQQPDGRISADFHFSDIYLTSHAILEMEEYNETSLIERGIDFLLKAQQPNGSWKTPEETGIALFSLLSYGINDESIANGVKYLINSYKKQKCWKSPPLWLAKTVYSSPALVNAPILATFFLFSKKE